MNLNLSGFFNVSRCLASPSLCLPHATVSTFNDLPIPLDKAFESKKTKSNIKAVVLDKDDCFAYPESNEVFKSNKVSPVV
jgi:phosphatidylglycerophosphatase GEP4